MKNDKQFNEDPSFLNINPKPQRITKINRLPVLLIIMGFVFVLIFLIFNMSRKQTVSKNKEKSQQENARINSADQAVSTTNWFEDKSYDNLRVNPIVAKNVTPSVLTASPNLQTASDDKVSNMIVKDSLAVDLNTFNQGPTPEFQSSFNEAVKSPGSAGMNFDNSFTSSFNSPTGSYSNREESSSVFPVSSDKNDLDEKERFLKDGILPGEYLPHMVKKAISPYELKAGTIIPAALEGGLNSDLPGFLRARIRESVYDSVKGEYLLIPQGSLLIGEYQSKVNFGQSRVLVVWTRLIFPDGSSLDLEKMQGVDLAGYAGLKDKVNNHFVRLYSSALLMSVMGAGYEFLTKDENSNQESTSDTVASTVGQELGQVSNEVIRKNLNVSPTLQIRPGYKFNVLVQKDIVLDPWGGYESL